MSENKTELPKGYNSLVTDMEEVIQESEKFYLKGNKAASTRARKALANVAKKCKELRADILKDRS